MELFIKHKTTESIIDFFATASVILGDSNLMQAKTYLDKYLNAFFSKKTKLELMDLFQERVNEKRILDNSETNRISEIINNTVSEFNNEQKHELYFALLEYIISADKNWKQNENLANMLGHIIKGFNLCENTLKHVEYFIGGHFELINNPKAIIAVGNFKRIVPKTYTALKIDDFSGRMWALYVAPFNSFLIQYKGKEPLMINNQLMVQNRMYRFATGGIIKGTKCGSIFFSDLFALIQETFDTPITLEVKQVSKIYPKTNMGVQPLSFKISSGQLMAVMGGSGSGKTTLLNLLSGIYKPDNGKVLINNCDLHANHNSLKQHIGFVPQDDLLVEELTVYQNLMYSTCLCRNDLDATQQSLLVENTLNELDLLHIKDLKVGSPLAKVISGGQRKRLNIALELVRKPSIVYLDEPTSGLSSSDALSIINLLKKIANTGKIVLVNIHQPSSDIFFLLDKLLIMDTQGYAAYFGNPLYASSYFKTHLGFMDTALEDSIRYGQFNPERVIDLLEYKQKDAKGNFTLKRVFSNKDWYTKFNENRKYDDKQKELEPLEDVPNTIPARLKQFIIYFKRNVFTRVADLWYMAMVFLGAPLLASVLTFFLKATDSETKEYLFSENVNIPTYLFICVIISVFLGLILSSGEIFRDLKILKRESFFNLSKLAYLNSKLVYVMLVNAYQIGMFVVLGNYILEIKGLFWHYFLVLWLTATVASLIGLLISAKFKSILAIYITIPFIIIPKILLAGAILDFDNTHHSLSSDRYVPVYADLSITRWAYEGLVDIQFSQNKYDKDVFPLLIEQSTNLYYLNYVMPTLETNTNKIFEGDKNVNHTELTANIFEEMSSLFSQLKPSLSGISIKIENRDDITNLYKKIKQWFRLNNQNLDIEIDKHRQNNLLFEKKNY